MTIYKSIALVAIGVVLLVARPVGAETASAKRLQGPLPEHAPLVSIDQLRGTVLDALTAISKQMGSSLVVTAPESLTGRSLTMQLNRRPAAEAIELALDAGGLTGTYRDGVLTVRPAAATSGADAERDARRTRRHRGERVVFGQSLRVEPGETIESAVAIGGSLTILGHVRKDAVAIGGSVSLLPGARVEGNAVSIGGTVTVEEGAQVDGDNVSVGGKSVGAIVSSLLHVGTAAGSPPFSRLWILLGFASRLVRSLLLFALALLIVMAVPANVARVRAFLVSRPGLSSLGGIALLLGFAPLCVLLAVTLIGIPLIPIAAILLFAILLFGLTAFCLWLGERIPLLEQNKTPLKAVALGGGVLVVVGLIPWIGTLVIVLAALVSSGAALLSRLGRSAEARA